MTFAFAGNRKLQRKTYSKEVKALTEIIIFIAKEKTKGN